MRKILLVLFCWGTLASGKEVRIVGLTDFHGQIEARDTWTEDGQRIGQGGAALLAAYVTRLRQTASAPVFILDAGDLLQGTFVSNSTEGAAVIRFYNHLGVDAAAIGNHEFDYGPSGPARSPQKPGDDPQGALKERMKQAQFPFLSSNITFADGRRVDWIKPSVLLEKQGVKVGVIGVTTTGTPSSTLKANVENLAFQDPVAGLIREARELRARGADFVVAVFHEGEGCRDNSPEKLDDLSSCIRQRFFPLLEQIPSGLVDLTIAGHTHMAMAKRMGNIGILQSGSKGSHVGWVDLKTGIKPEVKLAEVCDRYVPRFSGEKTCDPRVIETHKGATLPPVFLGEEMRPDPEAQKEVQPDLDRVEKIVRRPLGVEATDKFLRPKRGEVESSLGNLLMDLSSKHFGYNVDLAMANNTGIRADLPKGRLTFGDLYNVSPFDDSVAVLTLEGREIRRLLELLIEKNAGGYSWSGLTYETNGCLVEKILVQGRPLEDSRRYRVLTSEYLGTGGGLVGLLQLKPEQLELLDSKPTIRDHYVQALTNYKSIAPEEFFNTKSPRQKLFGSCE